MRKQESECTAQTSPPPPSLSAPPCRYNLHSSHSTSKLGDADPSVLAPERKRVLPFSSSSSCRSTAPPAFSVTQVLGDGCRFACARPTVNKSHYAYAYSRDPFPPLLCTVETFTAMSLTVEKLNDDTTFLFSFAPSFAPSNNKRKLPGAFTILVDPWLAGQSSILHPVFQLANHTAPAAIKSLAELKEHPDLIIISQDKPDHCHRETLCSLPANTRTRILATPAAAKTIRAWKYVYSQLSFSEAARYAS